MSDIVSVRSLNNGTVKERYKGANFVKKLIDLNNLFEQMGCKDKWKCLRELYGSGNSLKTRRDEIIDKGVNQDVRNRSSHKSETINATERLKGTKEVYTTPFENVASSVKTTENILINTTANSINQDNVLFESTENFSTTEANDELLIITPIWESSVSNQTETPQNNEANNATLPFLNTSNNYLNKTTNLSHQNEAASLPNITSENSISNLTESPQNNKTNNATLPFLNTSDNSLNISTNLPHQKEVAMLVNDTREQDSVKTQLTDDEETQTSRYDYPYVHKVDQNLLNETLYSDMDLKKIKNYCRNPSRDISGWQLVLVLQPDLTNFLIICRKLVLYRRS